MIERYVIKDLISHGYWSEYGNFRGIIFAVQFELPQKAELEIERNIRPGTYQIIKVYIKINFKHIKT